MEGREMMDPLDRWILELVWELVFQVFFGVGMWV